MMQLHITENIDHWVVRASWGYNEMAWHEFASARVALAYVMPIVRSGLFYCNIRSLRALCKAAHRGGV